MKDATQNPEGLWTGLESAELSARLTITGQLKPFARPVCDCYEAGVQSQCLPGKRHSASDLRVAALYLKRALMDLRATWLLCLNGYTAQAASVAASLFENALTTEVIAGDIALARQCMEKQGEGLPWSVRRLTDLRAAKRERLAKQRGETFTAEQRISAGEVTYFHYRWLCKIKHPTIPALLHEASGTKVDKATFVIMALPNAKLTDRTLKGLVLTDVVLEAKAAICAFAEASEPDTSSAAYISFADRIARVTPQLSLAFHQVCAAPPPFLLEQHAYTIRSLDDPFGHAPL